MQRLRAIWHGLMGFLCCEFNAKAIMHGHDSSRVGGLVEASALALAALQPSTPRSHFQLGRVALINHAWPNSRLTTPIPNLLRGLELAREQGSDFWLARCVYIVVLAAAPRCIPEVSPTLAAKLLAEADAACKRIKQTVHAWNDIVEHDKEICSSVRHVVSLHLQRSPGRWEVAIADECMGATLRDLDRVMEAEQHAPTCDGCGQRLVALRQCKACKQTQYCR